LDLFFECRPFNPWPGAPFECSSYERIVQFSKTIESNGIHAPIRWPRGDEILAACGQLKTLTTKQRISTTSPQHDTNSSTNPHTQETNLKPSHNNNHNHDHDHDHDQDHNRYIERREDETTKMCHDMSRSAMSI
jgi:hypothetical protein